MEEKQLNFNQPLLSVRRFSSTVASEKDDKRKTDNSFPNIPPLPSYKSELKSGPVRNPGTVPFIWERSPGRPKDERKPQTHAIERPPIAPKLPPGRILNARKQDSDKVGKDSTVTKCPGKVPYGLQSVPSSDGNETKFESSKDTVEEESSDSGDSDEAYLDALDTLSRTESVFLNCSESGVSGLDGSDLKPSGTVSTDPCTRDFMMGRFLPAAKAMTSETPQHAPRKQPVVWEQPKQVKKVVSRDKQPPLRYGPSILPHYAQDNAEEESDDDYDENRKLSAKVCGLLPRFCFKNSLCLLNPVPGMSVRTRVPMSPVSSMQARSSSSGSCNEIENQHTKVAIYEQRSVGGLQTTELHPNKSVLKNESNQIQSNSQKLEGSTLYKRLQGSAMLPYCNELPQSPFSETEGYLGGPGDAKNAGVSAFSSPKKGPISLQELFANQISNGEIDSGSAVVEKTLYVDTVHKLESPNLNSGSSDRKGLTNLRQDDFKIVGKSEGMEENPLEESSFIEIVNMNIADETAISQPNVQKHVDFGLPSAADKSNQKGGMSIQQGFFGQDKVFYQDSTTSADLKVPDNVSLDFEFQQPLKGENLEISHGRYSEFPVPPPLPKSPSDSWLWRTLPALSSRNPSSQSYLGTGINPRNLVSKTSSGDTKWETIVKTAKELLTPIPET